MFNVANHSFKTATLIALGISAPSYAMASANNPVFNGYYGGIMGGRMQTHAKLSASATALFLDAFNSPTQLASSQDDVSLYKYTGTGAIYLGYGHFFPDSKVYLAGEVFGNWANRNNSLHNLASYSNPTEELGFSSLTSLTTTTSVKLRNSEYGLDIRPGYLLDINTMLYGRIGVAFNQVKSTSSNVFLYTDLDSSDTPAIYSSAASQTRSHNSTALRLGFGLEHKISEEVSITGDYIYTYYGKTNLSNVADTNFANGEDGGAIFTIPNGLTGNATTRVSTQVAMLGIKYTFPQLC